MTVSKRSLETQTLCSESVSQTTEGETDLLSKQICCRNYPAKLVFTIGIIKEVPAPCILDTIESMQ